MKRATTFWHLSDLHLEAPCNPHCPTSMPACHGCIKTALVERLARALEHDAPDLLLLAGDLFEGPSWDQKDNALTPLVDAAKGRGTVVVGIRGQHDARTRDLRRRFPWILGEGEANADTGVVVHALPAVERGRTAADRTKGTLRALADSSPRRGDRPSILLAHINAADFLRQRERHAPRFQYYALGDMHLSRVVRLDGGAWMGTPGHMYPYFDGSGKAWPTFMLKGSITASGQVDVERVPLQSQALGTPHARQLYVPHKYRGRGQGELVLVNAPGDEVLRELPPFHSGRPEIKDFQASGKDQQNVTLSCAVFRYRSHRELHALVRGLLGAMSKDVFVGLARGKGRAKDRWKHYGATILGGDLDGFVEACVMPTAKTQTSDNEGWLPAK